MMRSVPGAVRGCQMPALSAARASSALGPVLAPVRSYQGASRWKWAFRPDLRDKKPEAAATPEEKRVRHCFTHSRCPAHPTLRHC